MSEEGVEEEVERCEGEEGFVCWHCDGVVLICG